MGPPVVHASVMRWGASSNFRSVVLPHFLLPPPRGTDSACSVVCGLSFRDETGLYMSLQ